MEQVHSYISNHSPHIHISAIHRPSCRVERSVLTYRRSVEQYLLLSGGDDGLFKIWDLRTFSGGNTDPIASFSWHKEAITSLEWHPTDPSVLAVAGADDQVFENIFSVFFCLFIPIPIPMPVLVLVLILFFSRLTQSMQQVTLWDMAVELDTDVSAVNGGDEPEVPPQLLFIHQVSLSLSLPTHHPHPHSPSIYPPSFPLSVVTVVQGQTDIKELHWHPQIPGAVLTTAEDGFNFFKTISV